jgi:hypothetical protein
MENQVEHFFVLLGTGDWHLSRSARTILCSGSRGDGAGVRSVGDAKRKVDCVTVETVWCKDAATIGGNNYMLSKFTAAHGSGTR